MYSSKYNLLYFLSILLFAVVLSSIFTDIVNMAAITNHFVVLVTYFWCSFKSLASAYLTQVLDLLNLASFITKVLIEPTYYLQSRKKIIQNKKIIVCIMVVYTSERNLVVVQFKLNNFFLFKIRYYK